MFHIDLEQGSLDNKTMAAKMKALQTWCQQKTKGYRDVNITNMTTSWRDGMAFCALIHHYRPDLIDFDSLSKEKILHNNKTAFHIAETELGIAALLDAEDMVAMKVPDKLSIITYVSQYYNALNKLQPGAKVTPTKRPASPPVKSDVKRITKPAEEPKAVLTEKAQKFSLCEICKKKVHLVERFIDDGKIYHRHCHRTKSLSGMYRREGSAAMHNYMESVKSPDKPIDTKVNPFKAQIEAEKKLKPSPLAVKQPVPVDNNKDASKSTENDEKKQTQQFHVTDMVSKFSENKSKSTWTPTSNRNSGSPSRGSSNRDSTDSSEFRGNPFEEASDIKQKSGSSTPKHTWTPSSTPASASKRNSTDSADNANANPFLESDTKSNENSENAEEGKKNHVIEPAKSEMDSNHSNSNASSPSSTAKDMLPSLLKSLADVKSQKQKEEKLTSTGGSSSPSSAIAPLISELPKASARSEPSTSNHKPVPQPRASKTSTTQSDLNQDEVDYQEDLNPFAESDTEMHVDEPSADVGEPLNPFGNEEEGSEAEPDDGGNPFGDVEETYDVEGSEINDEMRNSKRTLNVSGPNEIRVNPFTEEYEHKKSVKAGAVVAKEAPKPPARRKGHAPPPPKPAAPKVESEKHSDEKQPTASPAHVPSPDTVVTPPERKHKRAAPKWKNEMEKKMEQLNEANKTDTKYVDKTNSKSPTPSNSSAQAARSPPHKHRNSPSKHPHKPARQAPGFGFPLVKRKVKSQMTEDEISTELKVLDVQLKDLEKKGVKLEEVLRDDIDSGNELKPESDQLLTDWFDLVHQKNKLVRRETDLVYLMQQQRLEQQHADVEFKIRKLLNKPDGEKTEEEKEEEGKLLEELVKIVEKRNNIINSIEEERQKEEEEDAAFDKMKQLQRDNPNDSDNTKKKKKNKVKKMFSKRKKDKTQSTSSSGDQEQKEKQKKDKTKVSPKVEQKKGKAKDEPQSTSTQASPKGTKKEKS